MKRPGYRHSGAPVTTRKKTKQKQHWSNRLPFNYTQAEVTPPRLSHLDIRPIKKEWSRRNRNCSAAVVSDEKQWTYNIYNVPDLTNDIYFAIDSSRVLRPEGEDLLLSLVPQPFREDA